MSSPNGTATIGLQVVLADAASAGLTALGLGFLGLSGKLISLNNSLKAGATAMNVLGVTAIASGALFGIFAGAIGYSIEQGMGLQDALVQVQNSVHGTDQNMQAMMQTMIALGNQSIYSTQSIADGFAAMGKNGQTATDIIKYTGAQMITLAEALNTDTVPAANLLSSVMQVYGASADQATTYTKALTFAFYNGEGNVAGLQAALNQVAPVAANLGIPIQQLVVYLDALAQNGAKGAQAGTDLRYMLTGLVNPTVAATQQLANLGILIVNQTTPALQQMIAGLEAAGGTAGKEASRYNGTIASLQAIYAWAQKLGQVPTNETFVQWGLATGQLSDKLYNAKGQFIGITGALNLLNQALAGMPLDQKITTLLSMFSVKGGQGGQLLLDNYPKTIAQVKKLNDALAATDPAQLAARVFGQLSSQLKALGTSIQDAAGVIGLQLIPFIKDVVSHFNDLVGVFAKASPAVHQFAAVFLVAGAAITGLALVASVVAIAVMTVGTALLWIAGIGLGLLAAIGLVTGGFILIRTHATQIQQALAPLGGLFQAIGAQLSNVGTIAKSSFGPAFQQIGQIVQSQLLPALAPLMPELKIIGVVLGVTLVAAVVLFIGVVTGVIAALAKVLVGVVLFATGIVQLIGGAFQTVNALVGGLLAILGDIIHGNFGKIGTDAQNMWTGMTKGLGTIWSGFGTMLSGLVTATFGALLALFGGFIGSVLSFFGRLVPGIQNVPGQIVALFKGIPGQMASIGQQIIQGIVNSILNGVGAVGGAMRSLAGNMIGSLKGALGISSPSKVMMELGGNTATGFLQGITGTNVSGPGAQHLAGVVAATRSAVSGGISSAARSASGGAGGGGNTTIQFQIDNKTVATAVLQNLTGQLQLNGAARKSR